MDMCRIPKKKDFLLQALKSVETPITSTDQGENPAPTDLKNKTNMNTFYVAKKGKPFVPPFFLRFEFFKKNLHNCLVDSGASSNVMPLSICKKLNAVPLKSDKHAIQLDRTKVKVIGELKDVMIRMATHPKFVQVIDIIVVDIPEAYGPLLSRDWSGKLNGYFSTDWAHLWLPLKGHTNMIRIYRERYLKHTIIDLEAFNETSSIDFPVLGNYSCDSDFSNLSPLSSDVTLTQNSEMTFQVNLLIAAEESLFYQEPLLETTDKVGGGEEVSRHGEADDSFSQVWTMYFDGSKSQEGLGAGCILIDQKGKWNFLSCKLEFECTNNIVEYEALVQGLKKAIDLNIKELKVFWDSEIIVRQVKNTIHCNSPHLRNYQQEVHKLIEHFEAFNVTVIPRTKNTLVDSLATAASRLSPLQDYEASRFTVELLYKQSMPNNISNWKGFEGDEHIIDFLTNQENFKDLAIDDEVFQE
jgi:ribonuclease HI